jgi:hypothetical protein
MALTPKVRRSTGTVRRAPSSTKSTAASGKPSTKIAAPSTKIASPYVTGGGQRTTVKSSPTKSAPADAYKVAPKATKSTPKATKSTPKGAYKEAPKDAYKKAPSDAYKKAPSDAYKKAPAGAKKKAPKGSRKSFKKERKLAKKAAKKARRFSSRTTSTTESGMSLAEKAHSTPRSRSITANIRQGGLRSLVQPTRGKSAGHAKRSKRRGSLAGVAGGATLGAAGARAPVRFVGTGDTAAPTPPDQIGPKEQIIPLSPRLNPRGGREGVSVGEGRPGRTVEGGNFGSTGIGGPGYRQYTQVTEGAAEQFPRTARGPYGPLENPDATGSRHDRAMDMGDRIFRPTDENTAGWSAKYGRRPGAEYKWRGSLFGGGR